MKYFPNIQKNTFLSCIMLLTYLVNGQNNNASQFTELHTALSTSHQTEIKKLFKKLSIATKSTDSAEVFNEVSTIYLKSLYYVRKPKYDSILFYANNALKLCRDYKTTEGIEQYLESLVIIGAVHNNTGNFLEAIESFNKILNITENTSNAEKLYTTREGATTYLAIFYANIDAYTLAIKQFESLFEYVKKNEIDQSNVSAIPYLYSSEFYRKNRGDTMALKYATKAKEIAERNNKYHRVAMAYIEMAWIYYENEKIKEADSFLEKAFTILNKTEYVRILSKYHFLKAKIAERNQDFSKKIYHIEKAYELIDKKVISKNHIAIGKLLHSTYKEIANFEAANKILEQVSSAEKKIFNIEQLKRNSLFEIQRRDQNIQFEQAKSQTKSNVIVFVILLFIMAVIAVFSIFKDRQKKIKLSLIIAKKNEQLQQLDQAKSQFFSNISHELQTPLTLIAGPLEQVLNGSEKPLDMATKGKLQMVLNNTDALKVLINDILDLSKLKAKKLKINTQNTDLDTFFNTTTRKFIPLTKQKDISFEYCFKDLENFHAIVDTKKLEKILNNLLSNAIKYTPQNGTISVKGILAKNNQLQIVVKDTGVGISATDIPQIFDRYFQSNDISKPLEGGSGIGLSLAKELVELMNGKITVESELSKGTTFTVTLPIEKATANLPESYSNTEFLNTDILLDYLVLETEFVTKEYTILIVEDHIGMQEFITSILQKRYKLLIANNGKEALEKLKTNTVDLIVSDVMMPVMDGFTLLEAIKQSETYDDIPVIMLTALAELNYKLKALTIGADDYLTKPFVAKELLARTHNLLERYVTRKKIKAETIAQENALEALLTKTDDETNVLTSIGIEKQTKTDKELITKVAELIEKNIDNPDFKLNDLTEEVFLSERQLRRKIKLITGLSTKKFQQEIQLLKARTLLEEDAYGNVTAVAISVGMDNVTRFSKLYVERFGKHPSSYFTS